MECLHAHSWPESGFQRPHNCTLVKVSLNWPQACGFRCCKSNPGPPLYNLLNLLANVWRSALTFSVMVRPCAPYFPVQISPAFHSPHASSLCVARDEWLRSTLKEMDRLYRAGSSRSAMTFNHLTSGIYLSVPVAIHVRAWGHVRKQNVLTTAINYVPV